MRFGAVFPTSEIGADPIAIRDLAQGVEELGFDHLVAYDHVLGAPPTDRTKPLSGPYDEHDEFHEVFVLFGHLAAVTRRIELVVGVLVAPQRQTALIAKQAAEVQMLSDGRLRLGLGTGWNWVEYESLGAEFEVRGAMLDEQVDVLRRLWSEPVVSFDGAFHQIDRAGIAPLPKREIPVWFGGYGPTALRRSARHGAGHLFGHLSPSIIESTGRLRDRVLEYGRSLDDVGIEAITDIATGPDRWAETAVAWQRAGGTHLSIRTARTTGVPDSGCRSVDDHLRAFADWRNALRDANMWTG